MRKVLAALVIGLFAVGLQAHPGYAVHEGAHVSERISMTPGGVRYLAHLELSQLSICGNCGYAVNHTPRFVSAAEAGRTVRDDELVLGLRLNGITRAYPGRLLSPPPAHIINDVLKGVPVMVTWCPLCHSGVVFERPRVSGRVLEFATAGLYKRDLVMYDAQTSSLWQQFTGEVLAGPLVGTVGLLHRLPADLVPWGNWKQAHPQTEVLAEWGRQATAAALAIYHDLARGSGRAGMPATDPRLPSNTVVVGVIVDGAAKAYVRASLDRVQLLNDSVGGIDVLVVRHPTSGEVKFFRRHAGTRALVFELRGGKLVDRQSESVWNFDGLAESGARKGSRLEEIAGMPAFWFAWVTFYPKTELHT